MKAFQIPINEKNNLYLSPRNIPQSLPSTFKSVEAIPYSDSICLVPLVYGWNIHPIIDQIPAILAKQFRGWIWRKSSYPLGVEPVMTEIGYKI